jgi:hypothetical protein
MTTKPYVHQPLGQEVEAIAGRYVLQKELRLELQGREVLCLIGHAAFDTACCGAGGCGYALVPGLIVKWKAAATASGEAVSEVEPVQDEALRGELERRLKREEQVHQVNFW